jgi:hypothetical protein
LYVIILLFSKTITNAFGKPQKQTKKGNQYSISPEDKSTSRVNIIAGLPVHVAEGDTSVIVPKDLIEKHILGLYKIQTLNFG